jgi:hypothetical protein
VPTAIGSRLVFRSAPTTVPWVRAPLLSSLRVRDTSFSPPIRDRDA